MKVHRQKALSIGLCLALALGAAWVMACPIVCGYYAGAVPFHQASGAEALHLTIFLILLFPLILSPVGLLRAVFQSALKRGYFHLLFRPPRVLCLI
jgi:hypothetical protein